MRSLFLVFCLFLAACATAPPDPPATIIGHVRAHRQAATVSDGPARVTRVTTTVVNKTLLWDANTDTVNYYNVYEVVPKTPTVPIHWNKIGTTVATSFPLNGLIVGSMHIYSVSAVLLVVAGPVEGQRSLPSVYPVR